MTATLSAPTPSHSPSTSRVFPGSDGSSAATCGSDEETWSSSDTFSSRNPNGNPGYDQLDLTPDIMFINKNSLIQVCLLLTPTQACQGVNAVFIETTGRLGSPYLQLLYRYTSKLQTSFQSNYLWLIRSRNIIRTTEHGSLELRAIFRAIWVIFVRQQFQTLALHILLQTS